MLRSLTWLAASSRFAPSGAALNAIVEPLIVSAPPTKPRPPPATTSFAAPGVADAELALIVLLVAATTGVEDAKIPPPSTSAPVDASAAVAELWSTVLVTIENVLPNASTPPPLASADSAPTTAAEFVLTVLFTISIVMADTAMPPLRAAAPPGPVTESCCD